MKRGGPLRSHKRLRTRRRLTRRQRLRQVGERAERERGALEAFRADVLARAGGRCERCGWRGFLHAHHLRPRSRGGLHHLNNGAALCWLCHGFVHEHAVTDWKEWIR